MATLPRRRSELPGSFSDGFNIKVFPHVTATGNICKIIIKPTLRNYLLLGINE